MHPAFLHPARAPENRPLFSGGGKTRWRTRQPLGHRVRSKTAWSGLLRQKPPQARNRPKSCLRAIWLYLTLHFSTACRKTQVRAGGFFIQLRSTLPF